MWCCWIMLELFFWSRRLLLALSIVAESADDWSVQWSCCSGFKVVGTTTVFVWSVCFSHCPPVEVVFIWTAQPLVFHLGKKKDVVCPPQMRFCHFCKFTIYKNTWTSDAMATWLRHYLFPNVLSFLVDWHWTSSKCKFSSDSNSNLWSRNMQRFKLELIQKEHVLPTLLKSRPSDASKKMANRVVNVPLWALSLPADTLAAWLLTLCFHHHHRHVGHQACLVQQSMNVNCLKEKKKAIFCTLSRHCHRVHQNKAENWKCAVLFSVVRSVMRAGAVESSGWMCVGGSANVGFT